MNPSTVVFEGTIFQMRSGFVFMGIVVTTICVSLISHVIYTEMQEQKKSGSRSSKSRSSWKRQIVINQHK